jgi:hypothetical protein
MEKEFFLSSGVMQEHLSTSASQPASHVSEFKSRDEERRSPHLKFELNVIKCLGC